MPLTETKLRAWQALIHAHHEVTRRLDADLRARHRLSLADYDVLLRLANAPTSGLRMTELAKRLLAPASTLTRRMDGLAADGLVSRERSAADSRVIVARLTPRGRGILRRAAVTHLRGVREHFVGRLSEKQLRAVADALEVVAGPHEPH